jgi:undecaprenyl-phosphate 4-deoxy-4-formamido-L-arabinose transferase
VVTSPPEISVVVPIYGNADTLPELVERLDQALGPVGAAEYVFVVDGSPDHSLEVLCELAESRPHLRIIEFGRNYGQHAALSAGFEAVRGQVVLILDADLQQAPEDLPPFVEAWRAGHDFVSGYRTLRKDPPHRQFGSWVMNRLVNAVTHVPLRDWGCPMAAIDRKIIDQVPYAGEQRRFLKPLVAKLSRNWHELGIQGHAREGESSYSLLALIGLALDFIVSFSRRPFPRLAGAGVALFALSTLGGLGYIGLRLARLIEPIPPVQVLVVFGALFGLQALILGMLGEYIHRTYRLVQGQPFFEVRREHGAFSEAANSPD